ncbi:MAG TPA: 2-oxoglutarate dehydrogenase E1 component, partial [Caldithrix sp.]|nr:2-oxoglutarate dehydrogenase E1 component [Caldithrix sp.]
VIDDQVADKNKVEKILFCAGKVYYDLTAHRKENGNENIAIIRIEQIYPLPKRQIESVIQTYKNVKKYTWLQEEPANAGALAYMLQHFKIVPLEFISRPASATPATGFYKQHKKELDKILEQAFGG